VLALATACPSSGSPTAYARRRPEETLLHRVVSQHWQAFRERAEHAGGLPDFVVDEVQEYLRCGILEHGVVHLACRRCGHALVVGFSCKRRGFCPSCTGRRIADLAAHLVDEVLPKVAIRQWVCSLPWRLRYPMAYDRELCADVLEAFIGSLRRSLWRRAKRALRLRSLGDLQIGALTFVHRCDSSLRLNVHFHTLALDGVYVRDESGALQFHRLADPTHEDVVQVATWTHQRLARVLERHGHSLDAEDDAPNVLADDQPALASLYDASAADRQLLGGASGQTTRKLVRAVREVLPPNEALADVAGVNIHAGAALDGRDRKRLERLCRLCGRPHKRHYAGRGVMRTGVVVLAWFSGLGPVGAPHNGEGRSAAMSRSGGRNFPGRSVSGVIAPSASSFAVGSACK
jgi:Transposase zinc-binding domain/Putative transposase